MRQVFAGWGVASKRKGRAVIYSLSLTIYYPHPLLQMSTSHVWRERKLYRYLYSLNIIYFCYFHSLHTIRRCIFYAIIF